MQQVELIVAAHPFPKTLLVFPFTVVYDVTSGIVRVSDAEFVFDVIHENRTVLLEDFLIVHYFFGFLRLLDVFTSAVTFDHISFYLINERFHFCYFYSSRSRRSLLM
jgi:hypothetical protein